MVAAIVSPWLSAHLILLSLQSVSSSLSHLLFTTQCYSSLVSPWTSLLISVQWFLCLFSELSHTLSLQLLLYCNGCSASLALINSLKAGTIFFFYLYSQSLAESLNELIHFWINEYRFIFINCHLIHITMGDVIEWMLMSSEIHMPKY